MTHENAKNWCEILTRAWKQNDINKIRDIFADTTEYYEDPFSKPATTVDEIVALWDEIKNQRINSLKIYPVAIERNTVVIRWYLDYLDIQDQETYVMDGIYLVEFLNNNKCNKFTQWWVLRE